MSRTDIEKMIQKVSEALSIRLLESFENVEVDIHVKAFNDTQDSDRYTRFD